MEPNPDDGFSTHPVSSERGTNPLVFADQYGSYYNSWQPTQNGYRHGPPSSGSVYDYTGSNTQSDWNGSTGYGSQPDSQTHFVYNQQHNHSYTGYQQHTYQMPTGVPFQEPYESYQPEFTDAYLYLGPENPQPVDTVQMEETYAIVQSSEGLTPASTTSSAYNPPDPVSEEKKKEKGEARKISNKESQQRKRSLEKRNAANYRSNDETIRKMWQYVQELPPHTDFAEVQIKLLQDFREYMFFEENERHNKKSLTNSRS
uniref:BHLH domain-containing protein n=1 Tax=Panagrellus redivivus TaxID=6233 RepID=A0A7E4VDT2_PANRE